MPKKLTEVELAQATLLAADVAAAFIQAQASAQVLSLAAASKNGELDYTKPPGNTLWRNHETALKNANRAVKAEADWWKKHGMAV